MADIKPEFDIQTTVHRDVFLYWEPMRCSISQIYLIKLNMADIKPEFDIYRTVHRDVFL